MRYGGVMAAADLGKVLLAVGVLIAAAGGLLALGGRLPFGGLPGDLSGGRDGFSWYIPLGTCVLISVVLTVLVNLLIRR